MERYRFRRWRATPLLVGVLALLVAFILAAAARASHNFSDVPTAAFYHNAVEWIVNRGITAGCAVGLYCPDAAVSRGQMAVFLQRLGGALTPSYLDISAFPGALDLDAGPVVCQTADFSVTGYPRTAIVDGFVTITIGAVNGPASFSLEAVYSTDGGTTWTGLNNGFGPVEQIEILGSSAFGLGTANVHARLEPNVGTSYRFGMKVQRAGGGVGDATGSVCETHVMILNRNGASTPLRP